MNNRLVLNHFNVLFPHYGGSNVETWFPKGNNGIFLRTKDGKTFMFTFKDIHEWTLTAVGRKFI